MKDSFRADRIHSERDQTAKALLKTSEDGIRFLEECATPYLAVDSQLGCHGSLGEVRYA